MRRFFTIFLFSILSLNSHAKWNKSIYWNISTTSWSEKLELEYQDFVRNLGIGRKLGFCRTADECLRSPKANPKYFDRNPKRLKPIYTDCADFPYLLRAYFSWMNDLPFSYTSDLVASKTFSSDLSDIRYSKFGNLIVAKKEVFNGENVNNVFQDLVDIISSATFRTNASFDGSRLFRDTYPVDIDKKYLVPGTVLYDPNGHVAVVYDVTANGKILLIDAHPDNSISAITYGEKFARSSVKIGGGFSNFRPLSIYNQSVYAKKNLELPGYSLIQFQKDPFIINGKIVSFYEYVRSKMASGDVIYKPVVEFTDQLNELCQDLKYREDAVAEAIKQGIHQKGHPLLLPENIYGTSGEWEMYATPARDARLRTTFKQIKEYLIKVITSFQNHHSDIDYDGDDLVGELRSIYLDKAKNCIINATTAKQIDLNFIMENLFALSFDPYHCPELRWGITNVANCGQDKNKIQWYIAEQGLRNRIDRDNTIRTDYDVKTLPNAPISQVPQPDLRFDKVLGL